MAKAIASPHAMARARSPFGKLVNSSPRNKSLPDGMPPPTPAGERLNMRAGEQFEGAPVHGRAALVAAAAADRQIVPLDSTLKVYWEGSEEWFTTKILGHRAQLVDGQLCFKHQCEYDGGYIEHDLGVTPFEVIMRAEDAHAIAAEEDDAVYGQNYSPAVGKSAPVAQDDQENCPSPNNTSSANNTQAAKVRKPSMLSQMYNITGKKAQQL